MSHALIHTPHAQAPKQTRRNKTELTTKSSQKNDSNMNRPIMLLNSVLFRLICFGA
jgi:hypothetical protein